MRDDYLRCENKTSEISFIMKTKNKLEARICEVMPVRRVLCFASVTSEQQACTHVAEREADDGGFVQVSPHRRLQRQKSRQIIEHIRLHATPPPGSLTADGPAGWKKETFRWENKKTFMDLKKLEHSPLQNRFFIIDIFFFH